MSDDPSTSAVTTPISNTTAIAPINTGDQGDAAISPADALREAQLERRRFYLFSAVALLCLLAGVIAVGVFAGQSACSRASNVIWGVALAAGGAATAVGVLAGYLFGIPRAPNGGQGAYSVNTSLEQISDWVVKILVGLGLTQLREAPHGMVRLAEAFERAVSNVGLAECSAPCCSKAVALSGVGQFGAALVLYFAVYGFLLGYAHMRLYLAPAFSDSDKLLNRKMRRAHEAEQQAQKATVQAEEATLRAQEASQQEKEATQRAQEASQQEQEAAKRTQAYESVTKIMLDALYVTNGYERAISAADEFIAEHGDPSDAGFWLRYACGWGQKAAASTKDVPAFEYAKQKAFNAVQRMIELHGEGARAWARKYWDTDDRGPYAENDLAIFRGDAKFIALLGPAKTAAP
jgi:hypothetical protein